MAHKNRGPRSHKGAPAAPAETSRILRRAPKVSEIKLRVSKLEKATLRKAAATAAARFQKAANPDVVKRRPLLRERFLSEWARLVLLRAAKRDDFGLGGDWLPAESRADVQEGASGADRAAAWKALEEMTRAGWRSESPYGHRDELHDR